ncbi:DNA polymerase III subunit alpha [Virgibacillus byunsanensis]|uniref:DNA polymerase III subunit alpha n=1 Tax=Virgibacillus byunsanensis TaxID=570945 RepID=A0ABW3LMF9_9BACI
MSFTHLQVRSGYSLMESTITIEKLVEKASSLHFDALALTDEHVLYGAISFYKTCERYGVKPIIGMSVKVLDEDQQMVSCILLAKSNKGYNQLSKLSTYIQQHKQESITIKELQSFIYDLICILPTDNKIVESLLLTEPYMKAKGYIQTWRNMFHDEDFYFGILDHGLENDRKVQTSLKAFHENYQIPVVAINDVRYLNQEDVVAYDCLQAMKKGNKWSKDNVDTSNEQHHLRSSSEMDTLFQFWPEVIEETTKIKKKCNVSFDFNKRMLPAYPVPEAMDAHEFLEKLCWTNVEQKYDQPNYQVNDRLSYELSVIQSMQYSDYFLIVWDFIAYAKNNNITVGPGRGSSAGSLVAFVLGITEVDPMKYNLIFERFLNPERITMPDIDIDFSDQRRDDVIDYVRDKYGHENVAQIITFGTFAARSLLRELMKTISIDQQDANFILKEIPIQAKKSLREYVLDSEGLKQYIKQSPPLTTLFSIATKLEGIPRHISTHAAGVVISEQPLVEHTPLTVGANETSLTQFPMNDLEAIGLLKMDFLGLRNLSLLEKVVRTIGYTANKEIDYRKIPEHDVKTFELLQKGKTNGVFQLESKGMKQVLTQLKPTSFEDIVAVNALFRPGPMEYISVYIDRKHRRKPVTFPHPDLEPILKQTYGVLIYQEQILQIAHKIAGFSLGEADVLRRAVSKKQQAVMDQQKEVFIQGCLKNRYEKEVAEELFAWVVKFSDYGFPRSHAVAYSKISYQLAYLKAHYPACFFAELLSSVANQQDKIQLYLQEMKELEISLASPSINKSFGKYAVESNNIRMGLLSIKGIGNQVVREIIQVRNAGAFKSLFDFCLRISLKIVTKKTIETLILAGAFDELYTNRASLLASIDQAIEQGELFGEFNDQPSLFHDKLELEEIYVEIEDFSQMKKLTDEKELLGVYVSSHPLQNHRHILRENGHVSLNKAQHLVGKKKINSAGIIQTIKPIRTKRGDSMAFMTIEDETGEMEAVIFPDLYRNVYRWLQEEMIIVFNGKVELRNKSMQWIISDVHPLKEETFQVQQKTQRLFIKLSDQTKETALKIIKNIANESPGSTPIIVYHAEKKQTYKLANDYYINPSYACLQSFISEFGKNSVVLEKRNNK